MDNAKISTGTQMALTSSNTQMSRTVNIWVSNNGNAVLFLPELLQ